MSKGSPMPRAVSMARALGFITQFVPGDRRTQIAGSLRRGEDQVNDIDIVTTAPLDHVRTRLKARGIQPLAGGTQNLTVRFKGQQVNVYHTTPSSFGAAMMFATGPKGSNIRNRMIAKKKGWTLSQHGLFDKDWRVIASTERGIYEALGKSWRPPEKRGLPR